MRAVFEEVNGEYAVFLVEELSKTYSFQTSKLPRNATVGDVFEVRVDQDDTIEIIQNLPEERKQREESNRLKREALKRKSSHADD